jgi:hypothetical protein
MCFDQFGNGVQAHGSHLVAPWRDSFDASANTSFNNICQWQILATAFSDCSCIDGKPLMVLGEVAHDLFFVG